MSQGVTDLGAGPVRLCALQGAPQKDGAHRGRHKSSPSPRPPLGSPWFPSPPTGQTVQVDFSEQRGILSFEIGPSLPGGVNGFQRDLFGVSSEAANTGLFRPHRVSLSWDKNQGHGAQGLGFPRPGLVWFPFWLWGRADWGRLYRNQEKTKSLFTSQTLAMLLSLPASSSSKMCRAESCL